MTFEDRLKEYELTIKQSESPDRKPIDFSIEDGRDGVCWVWGDSPDDVEIECDHPYQSIDWEDDDKMGECMLCGAQCSWRWESDGEGGMERNIYQWHRPDKTSGLVKKYLEENGGQS